MAVKKKRGYVYKDCNGKIHWNTFSQDYATYGGKLNWIKVEVTCGNEPTTSGIFTSEFTLEFT